MHATKTRPAFDSAIVSMIIISIPIISVILKFLLWDIYGVFDFHTFHLAGLLSNSGEFDALYQSKSFIDLFDENYNSSALLLWLYPPLLLPYCQLLALFPVDIAYLLNGLSSIAIYFSVIRYAFPAHFREILVLSAFPLSISLVFGHPTLLFLSALVLGYRSSHSSPVWALLALSIVAIKPHIGGVILFLFFVKVWPKSLVSSFAIAAITVLLPMLAYDTDIWWEFFNQLQNYTTLLHDGSVNSQWISSAHDVALRIGLLDALAGLAHLSVLAIFIVLGQRAFENNADRFWVLASLAGFFLSPYIMIYDLPFLLFPLILVLINSDPSERRNWTYTIFIIELAPLLLVVAPNAIDLNINFWMIAVFVSTMLVGSNVKRPSALKAHGIFL